MDHPHPRNPARVAPDAGRPILLDRASPGRAHWTPAKQRIFLTALLDTGSVARAARAAGMSPSSAHRLRARLAGTPFDRTWNHVLGLHAQRLADPLAPDTQHRPQPRVAEEKRR